MKDLEQLYWFPVSGLLVEAGARFEGPEHPAARALFRRGENFFLEQQKQLALPLASLKGRLQRQGSLGRGKSFLLEQLLSRQGVVLPFGQYLLSPRYEFLRSNFLHFGDRFLLFLAYYYSQEP